MIQGYDGCKTCPLADRPAVLGHGPVNACVALVGEAPGRTEVDQGRPFVGASGRLISEVFRLAGVERRDLYVTNAVLCHPEGNATPSAAAIEACRPRLIEELSRVSPKKILISGGTAAKSLLGVTSIVKARGLGQMIPLNGTGEEAFAVPTYHPAAVLRDADLFRDLMADVQKLASREGPEPREVLSLWVPSTPAEVCDAMELLMGASVVSCDLETTGLNAWTDKILSFGFGALTEDGHSFTVVIPDTVAGGGQGALIEFLYDYDGVMVFHNAKFDVQFLKMWLNDIRWEPKHCMDTLLMTYSLDERGRDDSGSSAGSRGYSTVGLKDQARLRYDIPDYKFDFEHFYATPDDMKDWLGFYFYQAIDLATTVRLYFDLLGEMEAESSKLLPLVRDLIVPGSLAFAQVELRGFPIDIPYLEELRATTETRVGELVEKLQGVAKLNGLEEFNPASPVQVKKLCSTGWRFEPPNFEKETLQMAIKLDPLTEECREFLKVLLEYRQRSKVLKTYVEGLLKRVDNDSRIRPDFLLHGTDTGRLSCRDPNLQNIPTIMGSEIKHAFVAPEGWLLFNCDYSQLELRVAAWYSRDENLTRAFVEGKDVHRWVASLMFHKPLEEITSFERYLAKYVDFGLLYGRTAQALTEGFEAEYILEMTGKKMTSQEADEIQRAFFAAFPMLEKFIKAQHAKVRSQQYIETPMGRRRRFPYLDRSTVSSAERKSVNTPIQSLASDMTLTSILRLTRELPEDAYVVSSVHDSIMCVVREDLVDQVLPIVRQVMETPCIPEFDIPLRVDIEIGKRWSEVKSR